MTQWHDDGYDSASLRRPNGMYEACVWDPARVTIVKIKFGDEKRAKRAGYYLSDGLLMFKQPSDRRLGRSSRSRSKSKKRDKSRQSRKKKAAAGEDGGAGEDTQALCPKMPNPMMQRQSSRAIRRSSSRGRLVAPTTSKPTENGGFGNRRFFSRQGSRLLPLEPAIQNAATPAIVGEQEAPPAVEEKLPREATDEADDDDELEEDEEHVPTDGEEESQESECEEVLESDDEFEGLEAVMWPTKAAQPRRLLDDQDAESDPELWHDIRRRFLVSV